MKKVLFGATLAALMSFSNLVQAQITITLADFAAIGDTVIDLYDTLVPSGTTVGGTGNQTWDYSSLQLDYMDTTYFVDPSTTTNGADFPSASLASGADDFYIYLEANTNGVFFSGLAADFFGTGVPSSLVYAPVQKVMEFPSTDGTGYNDTSGYKWRFSGADVGAPIDSIGVYHTSYFTSIVDAYGTVTTPSGTYQTIRQYTMEITYDSVMMNDPAFTGGVWQLLDPALIGAPNPTIDTSYNYHWFANGEDAPVLEMQTDGPAGNVLEANFKLGTKLLAVAIASSDVSCFGDCDGSLEVAALSGTAPFAYSWDDPTAQTTATATGLCPGNYQVTIIDGINDTAIAMFTVGEPDSLAIGIFGTNPSCDTCPDGWVSATVSGGTLPYAYVWNDPASQTGSSAINLMNGAFSVVVTDTNGCTIASGSIVLEAQLTATVVSTTGMSCFGVCDGSIEAAAINGTGPYNYLWDDPAAQTTSTATGLCAGTYVIRVIDAASDTAVTATIIVEPADLTVAVSATSPTCDTCADGSVNAAVSGGTAPLTYLWDDPVAQTGSTAINLMNGIYTITVTDANGCSIVSDSIEAVGIAPHALGSSILMYPNPTNGIIYLEGLSGSYQITVLDIVGRIALKTKLHNAGSVDLTGLPEGSYNLQIWDGKTLRSGKVVLIR